VGRRANAELKVRVTLAAMPAELRPAIIGASFTREGALAVAWEDLLASIDLATGEIQWTFRVSRDRFHFHSFHATEGRLYLYESIRSDRYADPMRMPSPGAPVVFKPEDAHHLLFCLSDFTGEVLWARKFAFEGASPFQEFRIEFLGKYLADQVSFLHMTSKSGTYEWALCEGARDAERLRDRAGDLVPDADHRDELHRRHPRVHGARVDPGPPRAHRAGHRRPCARRHPL